eukprot:5825709-Pleurochrysis_carterae.AAC.5
MAVGVMAAVRWQTVPAAACSAEALVASGAGTTKASSGKLKDCTDAATARLGKMSGKADGAMRDVSACAIDVAASR